MDGYTINQAAEKLGLTPFYIRKCLREDKIEGTMGQVPGTEIPRWMISEEELERFANRPKKAVGKRDDGRNKYVIYLNADEFAEHEETLADIGADFGRANPPKNLN